MSTSFIYQAFGLRGYAENYGRPLTYVISVGCKRHWHHGKHV